MSRPGTTMNCRQNKCFVPSPFGGWAKTLLTCTAAIGTLLGAMLQPALPATEVRGQLDEMQVQTQNASIGEVLNALSGAFNLSYKLPPMTSRTFTGRYAGTLRQVLARVLDGHDYILKVSDNDIEVIILGASGAATLVANGDGNAARVIPARASVVPSQQATPTTAPSAVPPLSSFLSPPESAVQ
jgi:hypothetical protein